MQINPIVFFQAGKEWWNTTSGNYKPYGTDFARAWPEMMLNMYWQTSLVPTTLTLLVKGSGAVLNKAWTNIGAGFYSISFTPAEINAVVPLNACYYFQFSVGTDNYSSEMLNRSNPADLYRIKSTNAKEFLGVPQGYDIVTYYRAEFWQERNPQEIENIEIVPGSFTRLRNEQKRQRKWHSDFYPAYSHEHLKWLFSFDGVEIANKDNSYPTTYIMQENYDYTPIEKYGLCRGECWLTEQPTITRNVI